MSDTQYYVLRTAERSGGRFWDGPFGTPARAEAARESMFDRERAFVARRVTADEEPARETAIDGLIAALTRLLPDELVKDKDLWRTAEMLYDAGWRKES